MRCEKHVRMIIRPDGTCTVDALNFNDATCKTATDQITAALAGQTISEHEKTHARIRPLAAGERREVTLFGE